MAVLHDILRELGELSGSMKALQQAAARASERRQEIYERLGGIEQTLAQQKGHGATIDKHEHRLGNLEAESNKRLGKASVLSSLGGGGVVLLGGWLKTKLGL